MYEKFHKTDKNLKICIGRKATLRYDNKNITDNRRTRTDKKESSERTEAGRVLYLRIYGAEENGRKRCIQIPSGISFS